MDTVRLIDTHSHLDADAFDADRAELVALARASGLATALLCAGFPSGFDKTIRVAQQYGLHYMLGIHPLFLPSSECADRDLELTEQRIRACADDPLFAGIGEIGLDGFVPGLDRDLQLKVFRAQLRLARRLDLPVSVHARRSVDSVSAEIRRLGTFRGAVHAFSGSEQQAAGLTGLGMKLGFGGAMTFSGSKRIRRVLSQLPSDAWVLETDAPDIPPAGRLESADPRTRPADIAAYAAEAARLRSISLEQAAEEAWSNSLAAFPRLKLRLRA